MASAGLGVANEARWGDGCRDAENVERQQARRGSLAGKRSPAYAGVTFGAGRRRVSRSLVPSKSKTSARLAATSAWMRARNGVRTVVRGWGARV